jgi:DNA-binding CsgD family transcriptional regulator
MLVGRARELAALEGLGPDTPLVLLGEAGVGKTRLLRAAIAKARRLAFEGGALASLQWMSYLPVTRALESPTPPGDAATVAQWVLERVADGLLVLDDLHWADRETLNLVPLLAGRIRLLGAVRTGDPGSGAALAQAEQAGCAVLEVEGLRDADAEDLLRFMRPGLGDDERARVIEQARGNPLLLEELSSSPEPSPTLRLALGARLHRCSPEARDGMAMLALLGQPAALGLVAGAEELVETGLVTNDGELAPRHAILAEAALDDLSSTRRQALHSRLARILREPGEAARHHFAAGEREDAAAKALEAAAQATRAGERARHLEIAAVCAEGVDADELRLEAAAALVELGDLEAVERLIASIDSPGAALSAEAALCRARSMYMAGRLEEADQELARGLELVGGSGQPIEVKLTVEQARLATWDLDSARSLERAEHAVGLARRAHACESQALAMLATARYLGLLPCVRDYEGAVRTAQRESNLEGELEAAAGLVIALVCADGEALGACRLANQMIARAKAAGLRRQELEFELLRASYGCYALGETEESIPKLEALIDEPALGPARENALTTLVFALAYAGRIDRARSLLRQASGGSMVGRQSLLAAAAEVEWQARNPKRVLAISEELHDLHDPQFMHFEVAVLRAWAAFELGHEVPGWPLARTSYVLQGTCLVEVAALAALTDPVTTDAAEKLFSNAAESWSTCVLANEVRCRWGAAEAAHRGGSRSRAREQLLLAEERALALGYKPMASRIRRSLRRLGVRRRSDGGHGHGAPSPREREVLGLVGMGLSSAEISERLGISRSTVETHIRSAKAKLGARTRRQAAALAAEVAE